MYQSEIQNSNAEAVSGRPEMGKDCPISSDDFRTIFQLASQYSSSKNYCQLDSFLQNVKKKYGKTSHWQEILLANEKFVLALIDSKLHQKEFREVYRLIETMKHFSSAENLISIWNEAHYEEEETNLRRRLTPVMKHRIRARFRPPPNVHPFDKPLSQRLPRSSTAILKSWFADHPAQMPAAESIKSLAQEANLNFDQVRNWFRRSIAKHKKGQVEKHHSSHDPTTKLNCCLHSAAANFKNRLPFKDRMESPSKYLKKDDQKCSSPQTNANVPPLTLSDARCANHKGLDVLEFQDEDFLGYVPAYCIRNSDVHQKDNMIVMFDARSIRKSIPNSRSTEAAPVREPDPAMAYKTIIQAASASI